MSVDPREENPFAAPPSEITPFRAVTDPYALGPRRSSIIRLSGIFGITLSALALGLVVRSSFRLLDQILTNGWRGPLVLIEPVFVFGPTCLAGLVVNWGLLRLRPWGRTLATNSAIAAPPLLVFVAFFGPRRHGHPDVIELYIELMIVSPCAGFVWRMLRVSDPEGRTSSPGISGLIQALFLAFAMLICSLFCFGMPTPMVLELLRMLLSPA